MHAYVTSVDGFHRRSNTRILDARQSSRTPERTNNKPPQAASKRQRGKKKLSSAAAKLGSEPSWLAWGNSPLSRVCLTSVCQHLQQQKNNLALQNREQIALRVASEKRERSGRFALPSCPRRSATRIRHRARAQRYPTTRLGADNED